MKDLSSKLQLLPPLMVIIINILTLSCLNIALQLHYLCCSVYIRKHGPIIEAVIYYKSMKKITKSLKLSMNININMLALYGHKKTFPGGVICDLRSSLLQSLALPSSKVYFHHRLNHGSFPDRFTLQSTVLLSIAKPLLNHFQTESPSSILSYSYLLSSPLSCSYNSTAMNQYHKFLTVPSIV